MGFLSTMTNSFRKSKKLQKLQKQISPPNQSAGDLISDFRQSLGGGIGQKDQALEEYLEFCRSDEGVTKVMEQYGLSKNDLKSIYIRLNTAGLGQYIKGHHAALSSIAYLEPLLYIVESENRGIGWSIIVKNLLAYWDEKIPPSGLINQISKYPPAKPGALTWERLKGALKS